MKKKTLVIDKELEDFYKNTIEELGDKSMKISALVSEARKKSNTEPTDKAEKTKRNHRSWRKQ